MAPPNSTCLCTAALMVLLLPGAASAQCPDGTPGPRCAISRSAVLARHTDPPLDERKWIVVPFDNLARNAEIGWLSQASVNLLYLSLSSWTDIRVVDDERVEEIQRETADPRSAGPITLTRARQMARRVGAGRLVMGDFLKAGAQTAITAKVFDVATGTRLRSVQENAPSPDSIIPVYGRLARRVVSQTGTSAQSRGEIGTRRLDAYEEYIAGTRAFHRFDLTQARRRFETALRLDSTFALAHYKLGQTIRWAEGPTDSLIKKHAAAAARLGTDLPARERSLIKALGAEATESFSEACDVYAGLLRADSLDVDATFGLGYCSARDQTLEAIGGDTSRYRFRTSLNVAFHAFRRVLELDPSNHLAFEQLLQTLIGDGRIGCRERLPSGPCKTSMIAFVRRLNDSLVTVPVGVGDSTMRQHIVEAARTKTRARNLELARQLATSWIDLAPDEARAHMWLGAVLLQMGRLGEAQREFTRKDVAGLTDRSVLRTVLSARIELAIKRWQGAEAARLVDSVLAHGDNTCRPCFGSLFGPAFGRFTVLDSLAVASDAKLPEHLRGGRAQIPRIMVGIADDSVAVAEARTMAFVTMSSFAGRIRLSENESFAFGLNVPRKQWPFLEEDRRDAFRSNLVVARSRNDTAAMRVNARLIDSVTREVAAAQVPDSGSAIIAADAYLILKDTLAALQSLRRFLDSNMVWTPYASLLTSGTRVFLGVTLPTVGWLWPRAALQRAELSAALGHRDEARLWYTRYLDLWSKADPEFQPRVERARAALAALGRP